MLLVFNIFDIFISDSCQIAFITDPHHFRLLGDEQVVYLEHENFLSLSLQYKYRSHFYCFSMNVTRGSLLRNSF